MAKQRKPKTEEPKLENSGAVVRHQKLCLSIDFPNRQIYGYTELEIVVPDIGIVGLHAENLGVESVLVDGEPAEFEYYPYHQLQHQLAVENENRWRTTVECPSTAADAAGAAYVSALERELVPNLLINCCKAFRVSSDTLAPGNVELDDGAQSSEDAKQMQKLVRVNYCVERTGCGLHFDGNVLHTNDQIRRARCWFPCIDGDSQRWCFDLEFTVAQNLVAVSSGTLQYQVLSKDDPPRKTFVYKLDVPALPRWISLVVAPFQILPDPRVGIMSHMCLTANVTKLKNTVGFFHNAFNFYEEYLGLNFPLGSYTQIFIAPEMMISSLSFGASMCVFSSQLLYDDNIIDEAINTTISLALALARQWFGVYITPEETNDEWLVDGLATFLTDLFIKKFLGNNEARYRRFKANCSVCKADDSGASVLSSAVSCKDLYGTHCIGAYGKLRTRKSVAVLQMLEKQMGPESFRKILQRVVSRARETDPVRSISTKEFRHFATKVGNLERPFVKEFFPRWVCSCGCPMFRMGFSYNKRKNLIELAVLRECTLIPDSSANNINTDSENRDADQGWPGMMSIRVHELDGMYDHPVLPLAGDAWQLLEISCHSKLATKRFIKPKKGAKPDGSDDNELAIPADMRSNLESPLLWLRADPEMEYLADIQFNQPTQMWINQLEKDGDVIAQAQAISALELPQMSFAVINSLTNFMNDSKGFWRARAQAAFVLARTSSEDTDWAGLLNLIKFYKSRRFDATIGLPKPNDFSDFAEYFVLEAIPHAVSMVRTVDGNSPREAIEFILQLLKYNDNTGNRFSDVFWLSTLVEAAGQLDFSRQSHIFVSPLLKRIDRLIQYDRLMPSYNGILTSSCIRSLTQLAVKFDVNADLLMDNVIRLVRQFKDYSTIFQVKVEANRGLIDLECHCRGLDAALTLFMAFLKEESSLRGQVKLAIHAMRLCQSQCSSESQQVIQTDTLLGLLCLLETDVAFNNVLLRHYLFCILQVVAGRQPTLFGVRRDKTFHLNGVDSDPKNIFTALEPSMFMPHVGIDVLGDAQIDTISAIDQSKVPLVGPEQQIPTEAPLVGQEHQIATESPSVGPEHQRVPSVGPEHQGAPSVGPEHQGAPSVGPSGNNPEQQIATKDEQKTSILKIKVKRVEDATEERSHCSSVSVDAPGRHSGDGVSVSNQREGANSCVGSRTLADCENVEGTADSVKKRKRDDPQYLERKRLKKERKQKKKEMSKVIIDSAPQPPAPLPTAPSRFRIKIKNNLSSQPPP